MTTTSGWADTIWRVASIPVISGMLMSISTRAGCSRSTSSIASGPLDASPANSKPSSRRSTARAAERNGAWSSTTSTERGVPGGRPPEPALCGMVVTKPASHDPPPMPRVVPSASKVWPASPGASLPRALAEEHQHRLDPAVDVPLLRKPQLGEDGVGVLLHRALGDEQGGGDRGVALALGHLGEDLRLPGRQRGQARLALLRARP